MAREEYKIQKKIYTAPKTRNIVSQRTVAYSGIRPSGVNSAKLGIWGRAGAMISNNDKELLSDDGNIQRWTRNQSRILRAANNMLRRVL